jgi:hypothetical protein
MAPNRADPCCLEELTSSVASPFLDHPFCVAYTHS